MKHNDIRAVLYKDDDIDLWFCTFIDETSVYSAKTIEILRKQLACDLKIRQVHWCDQPIKHSDCEIGARKYIYCPQKMPTQSNANKIRALYDTLFFTGQATELYTGLKCVVVDKSTFKTANEARILILKSGIIAS